MSSTQEENMGAVAMSDEELEQVSGGFLFGRKGLLNTLECRPDIAVGVGTLEGRFKGLESLSTLELRGIPKTDARFSLVQEYLEWLEGEKKTFRSSNVSL